MYENGYLKNADVFLEVRGKMSEIKEEVAKATSISICSL